MSSLLHLPLHLLLVLLLNPTIISASSSSSSTSFTFTFPSHCDALIEFYHSFMPTPITSATSWSIDTDCCSWDRIACHKGQVIHVDLSLSGIHGTLHSNSSLFSLHGLQMLNLSNNHLVGQIPPSLGNLESLVSVDFSNNKFSGSIPTSLGRLRKLSYLDLSENQLQGSLPRSLSNCTFLEILNVGHNRINDTFPNWLPSTKMIYLDLQTNLLHGHIPSLTAFPFPNLHSFIISDNYFTGQFPTVFFTNSSLKVLDLKNNSLEGSIPIPPRSTVFYSISANSFMGEIPSSICSVSPLKIIDLSSNNLRGKIPRCFVNLTSLTVLNLRQNMLFGIVPQIFVAGNWLRIINLSQNQLVGEVPRSMRNCNNLQVLDLSNNGIEDVFPGWLGELEELKILVLRSNRFFGQVTNSFNIDYPFPRLQILDISENSFSGLLPKDYMDNFQAMKMNGDEMGRGSYMQYEEAVPYPPKYLGTAQSYQVSINIVVKGSSTELVQNLGAFKIIDLSSNNFQGAIPELVGNLQALKGLNLSRNNLIGAIPSTIGKLINLEWLDLSSNELRGEIPQTMMDMTFLAVLNLSENLLCGMIPQGKQFKTFNGKSFEGNLQLCGSPLSKQCISESNGDNRGLGGVEGRMSQEGQSWMEWRVVTLGYILGLILGIFIAYLVLETGKPLWLVKMIEKNENKIKKRLERNASRARTRRAPLWSPPPRGWLKWNVDGSARIKFGLAGVGGVLRNSEGQILCLFSAPTSKMKSNEAELKAVRKAMEITVSESKAKKGNIIIETSSLDVIRWLGMRSEHPQRSSEDFYRISALKDNFEVVSFRYITSEINGMANALANQATSRTVDFLIWFHKI